MEDRHERRPSLRCGHDWSAGSADASFRARPRVRVDPRRFGLLFTLVALDDGVDSMLLGAFLLGLCLETGPVTTAVFDDTCGNLIQIAQRTL